MTDWAFERVVALFAAVPVLIFPRLMFEGEFELLADPCRAQVLTNEREGI